MSIDAHRLAALLYRTFGPGPEVWFTSAPGRVTLLGEHIDYHLLPVLPMALPHRIHVAFRSREDRLIRAVSADGYAPREFAWNEKLEPYPAGDWGNYLKAAAQAIAGRWGTLRGIDAAVTGNIPSAAGLASSSALLVAFTKALLDAGGVSATFEDLMGILPEGEHFVGTRGGGMDHAAALACPEGSALYVEFDPVRVRPIPIPPGWKFYIVDSGRRAEKSSTFREEYNARRFAGHAALMRLGYRSFRKLMERYAYMEIFKRAEQLPDDLERRCLIHVVAEATRVQLALGYMEADNPVKFGRMMFASHYCLRDLLQVSCPELDQLVESAGAAGAFGARLTGAGFGGNVLVLSHATLGTRAVFPGICI